MNTTLLAAADLGTLGKGIGAICLYALVGLLLMVVGFYAVDLSTPGKPRDLVAPGPSQDELAGMIALAGRTPVLLHLLEDDEALASKVDEALTVLREYESREGTQAPN